MKLFRLHDRSVLRVYGPDAGKFLHGITTNDVIGVGTQEPIYNLILNPRGRYVFDFFLVPHEQNFLLDCASVDADALTELLRSYRLQLRVRVKRCDDKYTVAVHPNATGGGSAASFENTVLFQDPRDPKMWMRAIVPTTASITYDKLADLNEYELLRIKCTIPNCVLDMARNESFPLHFAMDRLNAISLDKGCYIGQEVVARMWRIGAKKKLYTVFSDTNALMYGQEIFAQGQPAGHMLSTLGRWGLCILEVEKITDGCNLESGDAHLKIYG